MHTITISINPDAQRDAILAGEPAERVQTYPVEQPLLERLLALPWTVVDAAGHAVCVVPSGLPWNEGRLLEPVGTPWPGQYPDYGYGHIDIGAAVRPSNAADAIDHAERALAAARSELDRKRIEDQQRRAERELADRSHAEQWAALPLSRRANADSVVTRIDDISYYDRELVRCVPEAWQEAVAERDRLREARDSAAVAAQAAKDERRRAQIAACVSDWGDESQRERLAEGLLPEAEALELIRDKVLGPLVDFVPYTPIGLGDIEHDECCYAESEGEVSCERDVATTLAREPYARFCEIRVVAEHCRHRLGWWGTVDSRKLVIEPREHACSCDRCHGSLTRYGVLVRLSWGELSVCREYALE